MILLINKRIRIVVVSRDDLLAFVRVTPITSLNICSIDEIDMTNMDELYKCGLSFSQGSVVLNCDISKLSAFGGELRFFSTTKMAGYVADGDRYRLTNMDINIPGPYSPINDVFTHIIQVKRLDNPYHLSVNGDFRISCSQPEMLYISIDSHTVMEEIARNHPRIRFEQPLCDKYNHFVIVPETLTMM